MNEEQQNRNEPRPTEPLPRDWKPAWRFLLFLFCVVAGIAAAAAIVDRMIYG